MAQALASMGQGQGGHILTGSYNMLYSKKSLFKSQQQRLRSLGWGWGESCVKVVAGFGVVLGVVKSRQRPEGVSCCGWKAADALATKVGAFTCLKSLLYARYVCAGSREQGTWNREHSS